jgi:hypothetical protein
MSRLQDAREAALPLIESCDAPNDTSCAPVHLGTNRTCAVIRVSTNAQHACGMPNQQQTSPGGILSRMAEVMFGYYFVGPQKNVALV